MGDPLSDATALISSGAPATGRSSMIESEQISV